jgi:hypothetical protein
MSKREQLHSDALRVLQGLAEGSALDVNGAKVLEEAADYYSYPSMGGWMMCGEDGQTRLQPEAHILHAQRVQARGLIHDAGPELKTRLHDEVLLRQCTFYVLMTQGVIRTLNKEVRDLYKALHPNRLAINPTDPLLQRVLKEEKKKHEPRKKPQ